MLLGWVPCPLLYALSCLPRTPLHAAAFADNIHGLQLLLRHQAEVDTTDKLGRTPLMMASENGHTAAVGTWLAGTFPGTFATPTEQQLSPGCGVSPSVPLLSLGPLGAGLCLLPLSTQLLPPIAGVSAPPSPRQLSLLVSEFLLYQAKANITVLDVNKNTALHLACSKVGSRLLTAVSAVTITCSFETTMGGASCPAGVEARVLGSLCLPVLACTDAPEPVLSPLVCSTGLYFLCGPFPVLGVGRAGSRRLVIRVPGAKKEMLQRGRWRGQQLSFQALGSGKPFQKDTFRERF